MSHQPDPTEKAYATGRKTIRTSAAVPPTWTQARRPELDLSYGAPAKAGPRGPEKPVTATTCGGSVIAIRPKTAKLRALQWRRLKP